MVQVGDRVTIARRNGSDRKTGVVESMSVKLDKPEYREYHDITHMTVGGPAGVMVIVPSEGGKRKKTRKARKGRKGTRRV